MRKTTQAMLAITLAALVAACGETTYEFQPIGVGDEEDRAPRAKSDSQYVRGLYTDLIGRAPESYDFVVEDNAGNQLVAFPIDEQGLLLFTLDGVGDPAPLRALIAAGLVSSDEIELPSKAEVDDPAAWISDQFRRLLGREPNEYELQSFVTEWENDPAVGPGTVIRALVGSREYQSF